MEREAEGEREKKKDGVPAVDVVVVDAAAIATAADVMSRLPSSRIALALALEGSPVPILAIAIAHDFHQSLASLACSRRSR